MSLGDLEERVRRDLEMLDFPKRAWMKPAPDGVFDVVVIGGGQSGLAAAYGLMRERIANVIVLDRAEDGAEGIWRDFARMTTLRTHKQASGLDFGIAALTPQAWYVARFGQQAWDDLAKIPREHWHEYLRWYRRVLRLPVRNRAQAVDVRGGPAGLVVELADGERLQARKVVLATGLDGSGRWYMPPVVEALPPRLRAHTDAPIDFAALAGRRVAVLGGGASAFDNAAVALEHGAVSVDLCIRLPRLPRVNPNKWMETPGFLGHFHALDDATRWRFLRQVAAMNQPPPQETIWRCTRNPGFRLHTGSPWLEATVLDGEVVRIRTPRGWHDVDFVISCTGIVYDLHARPELRSIAPHAALWADRYRPAADDDEGLSRSPYLGSAFEFTEREPGSAPWLRDVHNFTFGATASQGLSAASISGMKYGIRRLVDGIARDLFAADAQWQLQSLESYREPDIEHYQPGQPLDAWEASNHPSVA